MGQTGHARGEEIALDVPPLRHAPAEPVHAVAFSPDRPLSPSGALQLQRLAGNQAVIQLLSAQRDAAAPSVQETIIGSGSPLGAGLRQKMEAGLGADFSSVRLHTDDRAAASAESLGATAYTVGEDIVIGGGSPGLGGPAGERMLAHELTHVVQQRSGPVAGTDVGGGVQVSDPGDRFERQAEHNAESVTRSGGSGRTTAPVGHSNDSHGAARSHSGGRAPVQRMAFTNTDWRKAKRSKHSGSGGQGVFIVQGGDGPPIVVKPGEPFVVEAQAAPLILNEAVGGGAGGWTAGAPQARSVTQAEASRIHSAVTRTLDKRSERDRTAALLKALESNSGVTLYGFVKGKDADDLLKGKQARRGGLFRRGDLRLTKDSFVSVLINNPGLVRLLGRTAAGDVTLGNLDRLAGAVNLNNMMLDLKNKRLHLIDNVDANNRSLLHDFATPQGSVTTARKGFETWANTKRVKELAAGDFDEMISDMLDEMRNDYIAEAFNKRMVDDNGQEVSDTKLVKNVKAEKEFVLKTFDAHRPMLEESLNAGIGEGRTAAIAALRRAGTLTQSIEAGSRAQARTSLWARAAFLEGATETDAWSQADFTNKPLPALPGSAMAGAASVG